jgi:hypothetical protein
MAKKQSLTTIFNAFKKAGKIKKIKLPKKRTIKTKKISFKYK